MTRADIFAAAAVALAIAGLVTVGCAWERAASILISVSLLLAVASGIESESSSARSTRDGCPPRDPGRGRFLC